MPFLRIFKHLLPDAIAFRLTHDKRLREFFEGLTGASEDARNFADLVWEDLLPGTTRFLELWEQQWGLRGDGTDADRRKRLAAAWSASGGQDPRYLQDLVQQAGFDLYIHEWWSSEDPFVARDPRVHTNQPLIGTVQCGEPLAQCGEPTALCNRFLANDTKYLVNDDLTRNAPPPVPDDPATWPFFLYFGAQTLGDDAPIQMNRRGDLEQLLLSVCPAQQWIVLAIKIEAIVDEFGDEIVDETGDPIAV